MRKALTWAAAATTITGALLSVAATANAAPFPRKAPTTLSIRESAAPGHGHGREVIGGTLKQGRKSLAGESVTLDIVSGRRLIPAGTEHTSRAGTVSFTVSPKRTTSYELVFGGTRTLAGSHSGTVTVRVR